MGWQWHQLDHMQIIYTLLQTDNDASTSALSFYKPDVLPAARPTASKHWRLSYCFKYDNLDNNKPEAQQNAQTADMWAAGWPPQCKTPYFSLSHITGYYDPGWLQHIGGEDTNISCHVLFPLFVAICDHNPPTLHTDRWTDIILIA